LERTQADEFMISTRLHSLEARITSYELLGEAWGITEGENLVGVD